MVHTLQQMLNRALDSVSGCVARHAEVRHAYREVLLMSTNRACSYY